MRRSERFLGAAIALAFLLLATSVVRAQYIIPVSRTLHAQASASDSTGNVTDTPLDVVAGAAAGTFSVSATAISPAQQGRGLASTTSYLFPSGGGPLGPTLILQIHSSASGENLAFQSGPFGSGFASQQIVFDVPSDLSLSQSMFTSGTVFSIKTLKIVNVSGVVILNDSYASGSSFSNRPLFLPADRYTLTTTSADQTHTAIPTSGHGWQTSFTVVPEPIAIAWVAIGALFVRRRRAQRG